MRQPKDFFGEIPPGRIIGSEMEYDCIGYSGLTFLHAKRLAELGLIPEAAMRGGKGFYTRNGARIYLDVNDLMEYASPESLGPFEAMMTDQAGQEVIRDIVNLNNPNPRSLEGALMRRTGYGHQQETSNSLGFHENYLAIPEVVSRPDFPAFISSFLVTRTIWSGAGIISNIKGQDKYRISQKARAIGSVNEGSRTNHGNKPIIRIKDSVENGDTLSDEMWSIVETRCTDATMSPWVRLIGFAATSIVMRLREQDVVSSEDVQRLTFVNPVQVLHDVADDMTFKKTYPTLSGERLSAVDHQEALAEKALALCEKIKIPSDEAAGAEEWLEVCDDIRRVKDSVDSLDILTDRVDWAAKHQILARKFGASALRTTNPAAILADINWDRLNGKSHGRRWWLDTDRPRFKPDHDVVKRYKKQAPSDTRAKARSDLIELPKHTATGWNMVTGPQGKISIKNPYQTTPSKKKY